MQPKARKASASRSRVQVEGSGFLIQGLGL